ncbi:MAG: transposase [Candidatus Binatia bacterium]
MARKPRIHVPAGVYHAILRGNNRNGVFFTPRDARILYEILADGVDRFHHRIHAFCLMPDHLHLVIQVAEVSLSRIIHNVSFRYTQHMNRRHDRVGHLFQGRYKAKLVDTQSYLLEVVRYVHLNPARGNLVKDPARYRWSGHRAYLGLETIPWLTTSWILGQFSARPDAARVLYERFVLEGLANGGDVREPAPAPSRPPSPPARQSVPEHGSRVLATLDEIVAAVCRESGVREQDLATPARSREIVRARDAVVWLALRSGVPVTEVAKRLGRRGPAMSASYERARKRHEELAASLERILENPSRAQPVIELSRA